MLVFAEPRVLTVLFLLIPAVYIRHFWLNRGARISYPAPAHQYRKFLRPSVRSVISSCAAVLFWLSLAASIAAAAGPQLVSREDVFLNRGADIMFVIDESPSMAAQDLQPVNRFEAAKQLIANFIEGRKNNYIGLITFGKEAALQLPPTKDYRTLIDRLKGLQPGRLGDETAIGLGLGVACAHLQYSSAPGRIIILLTDGENNSGEIAPLEAARIAAAIDAVVYTCGIGRQGETIVEYEDPETGQIIRGSYQSYYDEILLREIAEITGGLFFSAPTNEMLSEMFEIIDRIETEKVETGFERKTEEKYRLFLLPAIVMFLSSIIIRFVFLREFII